MHTFRAYWQHIRPGLLGCAMATVRHLQDPMDSRNRPPLMWENDDGRPAALPIHMADPLSNQPHVRTLTLTLTLTLQRLS